MKDVKEMLMKLIGEQSSDVDARMLRMTIETNEKWMEWMDKIPYLTFPSHWQVKVIPPFACAMMRFLVKTEKMAEDQRISVYLDCFDALGYMGQPYWEVYPDKDGDTARCLLHETDDLLRAIAEAIAAYETRT